MVKRRMLLSGAEKRTSLNVSAAQELGEVLDILFFNLQGAVAAHPPWVARSGVSKLINLVLEWACPRVSVMYLCVGPDTTPPILTSSMLTMSASVIVH